MCIKEKDRPCKDYIDSNVETFCESSQYRIGGKCYQFLWVDKSHSKNFFSECQNIQTRSLVLNDCHIKNISSILHAIGSNFPPLLSSIKFNDIYIKRYRLHKILNYSKIKVFISSNFLAAVTEEYWYWF